MYDVFILNTKKKKLWYSERVKSTNPNGFKLDSDKIKAVPSVKYLGFVLDSTLRFRTHVNNVIKTFSHKRALLSRLMNVLNTDTATSIYKSMILPYFDYCDIIYQM